MMSCSNANKFLFFWLFRNYRHRLKDNPASLRLSLLPALEEVHLSHDGVHRRRSRGADSNKTIIEKPFEKRVGLERGREKNLTFNAKVISLATADCSREQSAHSSAVKITVSSDRLCRSRRYSGSSLCARAALTAPYTCGRVFIMKTAEAEMGKLPCGIFKMSDRILAGECFSSVRTEQWLFMLHKANTTLSVYKKGMLRVRSCNSLSGLYFSSLYPGPA